MSDSPAPVYLDTRGRPISPEKYDHIRAEHRAKMDADGGAPLRVRKAGSG